MIAFSQSRLRLLFTVRYLCGLYFFVFLPAFCTAQSRTAKVDVFYLSLVVLQNGVRFLFPEKLFSFLFSNAGNLAFWQPNLNSQLFQAKFKGFRTVTIDIIKNFLYLNLDNDMSDKETLEIYLHNCFLYVGFATLANRKYRLIIFQTN